MFNFVDHPQMSKYKQQWRDHEKQVASKWLNIQTRKREVEARINETETPG